MPMQVGSFVNDEIANLGNRYEKPGISPADMDDQTDLLYQVEC